MKKLGKVTSGEMIKHEKPKVLAVRKDFASHLVEECQKKGVNIFDGKIFNGQVIK